MTLVLPEYENWDDVDNTLAKSGANLLIVSPNSKITPTVSRMDLLNEHMPELKKKKYGDLFKTQKYPELKMIIQISHMSIPGTEKFKVKHLYLI